jgi:hypothetical protein
MTTTDRCGWDTGTVWTGPSRCGKPAKATTDNPATNNRLVCGIHARKALRFGAPSADLPDLPHINSLEAARSQPHAMVNDQGDVFYPDSEEDARWFAEEHGAWPLDAAAFPFQL